MGVFLLVVVGIVPLLQAQAAAPQPGPELILLPGRSEALGPECGLGNGGIAAPGQGGPPQRCVQGAGVAAGGVAVECRREGVHLRFPGGRELLFAPDGVLHLRSGEHAGPFSGGVELRLLDGSAVRIERGGSHRTPITEVVLAGGGESVRLWSRTEAACERVRERPWAGERLWCLGDGGMLYRAIALGPLVTLQRQLAPAGPEDRWPDVRLLLQLEPLLTSLHALVDAQPGRGAKDVPSELEQLVAAADTVFVADEHAPPRVGRSPIRYALRRDFELEFALDGGDLRLCLCRGQVHRALIEWRLGYGADVSREVASDQPGDRQSRSVRLPPAPPLLVARSERHELVPALGVVRALQER